MGSWLGTLFVIILVVSWVVKGLSALTGNDQSKQDQNPQRKRRSLEDWDEEQARRRAEVAEQSRRDEVQVGFDQAADPSPDLSQMTMAERIELARQRARQQRGGPATTQDPRIEAQRRARAEADQAARRRRAQAQAQQQEQRARAAREREQAARRQAAEERARLRQRELQKSRGRRHVPQRQSQPSTSSTGKGSKQAGGVDTSPGQTRRAQQPGKAPARVVAQDAKARAIGLIGPLDAASLRRAFVMKEVLDKPVALRNPQDDLLS